MGMGRPTVNRQFYADKNTVTNNQDSVVPMSQMQNNPHKFSLRSIHAPNSHVSGSGTQHSQDYQSPHLNVHSPKEPSQAAARPLSQYELIQRKKMKQQLQISRALQSEVKEQPSRDSIQHLKYASQYQQPA
jgi:hypothetical protein